MTTLTSEEIYKKLKSKILLETPFTSSELTEEVFEAAIDKSLSTLDQYKPRIVQSSEPIHEDGYHLLRAYNNDLDFNSQDPFVEELGLYTSLLYIYSAPWTAEYTYKESSVKKVFGNLVVNNAALMMANVRRSADMNNLPFNLKGDQFYQEAKDSLDRIEEHLGSTVRNTL